MIPRFTRPEMAAIWTLDNKFRTWLDIEIAVCEAQAELGMIPADVPAQIRAKARFDVARIDEIEREVRHDVIAFLTCVNESLGDLGRYVHVGLTSSDIIDTGFALQLVQSADILLADLDAVLAALRGQVDRHRQTVCIGRSHGIHAEPTTFGIKMAGHYAAFARAKKRLQLARAEIATCALSGAVGTFAAIDPRIEGIVAQKLGLTVEPVSTQIIPRDRHAMFFAVIGVIGASIENLATETRHLQRSEVREVEEFFNAGQKGSSAMPHKRNPVLGENLTGLARLMRAAVTPALENVTLWHERDISHSSVERVIAPDSVIVADFALNRLAGLIDKLVVHPERMRANLEALNGLIFSQAVLLALTNKGMSREDAYKIVQSHAMDVWDGRGEGNFRQRLERDSSAGLNAIELDEIFDLNRYTRHADLIIDRALAA